MTTAPFISELIRAANEVDRLAVYERSNLLQRAARTIRDMRDEVAFSEAPANDGGPGEIVHDLMELSARVDQVEPADIAVALLAAADGIRTLRILLDIKQEIIEEGGS